MKMLRNTLILYSLALVQLYAGYTPVTGEINSFVEKKKTIVKVFEVGPHTQLNIDNQFGDVKINLWNKREIRVDIVISANASNEAKALEYLNNVTIEEKKETNGVHLTTAISRRPSGATFWGNRQEDNSLRIDYQVSMPSSNPLHVKNKFGNTDIPLFSAPLTVEALHGNFNARDLENIHNTITVMYGDAAIGKMGGGKVDAKYSKLDLSQVKSLILSNKFGKLTIGEVESLNADIDYSGAKVGTLTGSGTVKLSYSNGFTLNECTADNISIQADYSSVVLPADASRFDVTVTYGSFQYPPKSQVSFTNYPDKNINPGKTRQYEGVVSGSGNKISNIKVVSKYSSVRLKE